MTPACKAGMQVSCASGGPIFQGIPSHDESRGFEIPLTLELGTKNNLAAFSLPEGRDNGSDRKGPEA